MADGILHHFHEEDAQDPVLLTKSLPLIRERMRDAMHGSEAVVAASVPPDGELPHSGGIYFLIWDDRVVYVGQAASIATRVRQHVDEKIFITGVAFICGIPKWWRTEIEHAYIEAWPPPWNAETRRNGNLPELPELSSLASTMDKTAVSEWHTPVMDPCSKRHLWPSWRRHILGCLQHRHPGEKITIHAWD